MPNITDDKNYKAGRHFNGSNWVTMPDGIYWQSDKRQYVDADGKPHAWNPNYPEENLPTAPKGKK